MKVDGEKLAKIIDGSLNEINGIWSSEQTVIGVAPSGAHILLKVTRDEDDIDEDCVTEKFSCVTFD